MPEDCYTDYHKIDELNLCKLIAHQISDGGPHNAAEVYGMMLLVLRLRDTNAERVAPVSVAQEIKAGGHFTDHGKLSSGVLSTEYNPTHKRKAPSKAPSTLPDCDLY